MKFVKLFLLSSLIGIVFFSSCRKTVQLNIHEILVDTLTTRNLEDMLFVSADTGFIVGGNRYEDGMILSTFDGGLTWHLKDNVSPWILYSIKSTPNHKVYTTGIIGRVLISVNNGKKWDSMQVWGPGCDFLKLYFVDNNLGFAVGGSSNSDGVVQKFNGTSWSTDVAKISRIINNIQMLNTKTGYIVGFGGVLKTTDGGNTWDLTTAEGDNFTALHFFNEQHGFVIGYNGTLLETTDGGANWNSKRNGNSPFNASWQFTDIAFSSEAMGYIAGTNGLLLKTTDGGNHWKKSSYFSAQTVRKIYIQSPQLIWLLGDAASLFQLIED